MIHIRIYLNSIAISPHRFIYLHGTNCSLRPIDLTGTRMSIQLELTEEIQIVATSIRNTILVNQWQLLRFHTREISFPPPDHEHFTRFSFFIIRFSLVVLCTLDFPSI